MTIALLTPVVSSCPQYHPLEYYTNYACAFDEGFADYFAYRIVPTGLTPNADYLERNRYLVFDNDSLINHNPLYPTDPHDPNGAKVEGAVASFLYDLTDPANEPWDQVAITAAQLANAIKSCRVSYVPPSGVDDLTYCLEQRIDPAVGAYFYGRTQPTIMSEGSPVPASADAIRNAWLKALYLIPR